MVPTTRNLTAPPTPFLAMRKSHNWNNSHISEGTCSVSHNAPFKTEMYTFLFWMEYCGILNRCIMGFVKLVYCPRASGVTLKDMGTLHWYQTTTNHTLCEHFSLQTVGSLVNSAPTQYWKMTSINRGYFRLIKWFRIRNFVDISDWLIDSESEIQNYFSESMQPFYWKWSFHFGDSNHYREAGSSCYSK